MRPWLLLVALTVVPVGCGTRTLDDDPFLRALEDTGADGSGSLDGATSDDGVIGSDDGVVVVEDTAPTAKIACGSGACDPATQVCCVTGGGGGGGSATCTAKGACTGGVALPCSSPANCAAGEVCCLSGGGMGSTPSAKCAPTCTGRNNFTLCASDADCTAPARCQRTPGLGLGACLAPGGFPGG